MNNKKFCILFLFQICFFFVYIANAQISGGSVSSSAKSGSIFSISQKYLDDVQLQCGTDADAAIEWDTAQTQDDLVIGLSGSNNIRITEKADMSTNYGLAVSTNPRLCIMSADQTDTNDYACIIHDQTDVVMTTGTGGFDIQGVIHNDGAGCAGRVCLDDTSGVELGIEAEVHFGGGEAVKIGRWGFQSNYGALSWDSNAANGTHSFNAANLTDATEQILFTIGSSQNLGTTATSKLLALKDNNVIVAEVRHDGLIQSDVGFQPVTVTHATPTEPYDCVVGVSGVIIHVNDSNDTAESYLCYCGVDADDASYEWFKVQNPAVNCF